MASVDVAIVVSSSQTFAYLLASEIAARINNSTGIFEDTRSALTATPILLLELQETSSKAGTTGYSIECSKYTELVYSFIEAFDNAGWTPARSDRYSILSGSIGLDSVQAYINVNIGYRADLSAFLITTLADALEKEIYSVSSDILTLPDEIVTVDPSFTKGLWSESSDSSSIGSGSIKEFKADTYYNALELTVNSDTETYSWESTFTCSDPSKEHTLILATKARYGCEDNAIVVIEADGLKQEFPVTKSDDYDTIIVKFKPEREAYVAPTTPVTPVLPEPVVNTSECGFSFYLYVRPQLYDYLGFRFNVTAKYPLKIGIKGNSGASITVSNVWVYESESLSTLGDLAQEYKAIPETLDPYETVKASNKAASASVSSSSFWSASSYESFMRSGVGVIEKSLVDPIAFFNPNSIKGIDKLTSLTSGIRKISKDISKFVKLSGANVPGYLKWTDNMAKASADFSKELLDGTNDAAGFAQRIALQHVITSMAGLNRSINSANSQLKDLKDSKKESEAFNNFLIKGSIEDQLGDLGDLNKKLNILHKYISAIPSSSELNTDIRKLSSKLATTTTASKYGSVIKEKLPTVTIPYNSRTYKILDGSSSTTTKRSTNLLSTK